MRSTLRSTIIAAVVANLAIGFSFAQNVYPPASPAPTPSVAQTPAPPRTEPGNPAIRTPEANNPGAPTAGANSFTEVQAKSRIEANGYSNVSALKKDEKGIWRGTAMKEGKSVQVSLDLQGKVVTN